MLGIPNMRTDLLRTIVLATAIVLIAAGCGDDDGAGVASSSASGSGSGSGSTEVACAPVGVDLEGEATDTVAVDLTEYAYDPADIEVAAGIVTFEARNTGEELHELAFLPGGGDVPFTDDGAPDEDALEAAGAFETELEPGTTCKATYELAPGTYTIFCLIETDDGETHYEEGMRAELVVS